MAPASSPVPPLVAQWNPRCNLLLTLTRYSPPGSNTASTAQCQCYYLSSPSHQPHPHPQNNPQQSQPSQPQLQPRLIPLPRDQTAALQNSIRQKHPHGISRMEWHPNLPYLCLIDPHMLTLWKCTKALRVKEWRCVKQFKFEKYRPMELVWLNTTRRVHIIDSYQLIYIY